MKTRENKKSNFALAGQEGPTRWNQNDTIRDNAFLPLFSLSEAPPSCSCITALDRTGLEKDAPLFLFPFLKHDGNKATIGRLDRERKGAMR